MEAEGSLSYPQEPTIGPYPEPSLSTPPHPISLRPILILSLHLNLGPVTSSPLGPNNLLRTLFSNIFSLCSLGVRD